MSQMNAAANAPQEVFFLSEFIGARCVCNGKKVGSLKDVVAFDQGRLAEITQLQIGRTLGSHFLLFPFSKVKTFGLR